MLERTAVVATSYSRDTLFLHGWGSNCNPLRLALYESAGMTAKLSLYSTDCIVLRAIDLSPRDYRLLDAKEQPFKNQHAESQSVD